MKDADISANNEISNTIRDEKEISNTIRDEKEISNTIRDEKEISNTYHNGKLRKVIETGALVVSWIVMGMYAEVSGPCMIDLKHRFNTGYEELASALSARGAGSFPGCIVGGLLVDKLGGWSHLTVAITLDVAAIVVVLMPWVPTVDYIWILCFISGFVQAIHNSAGTLIALKMWKDKSASPLILIHLGYGIGSFFTPLISGPFLGQMIPISSNQTILSSETNISSGINGSLIKSLESTNKYYIENSKIEYPYAICGIATGSLSFAFFVFQIIENKYIKNEEASQETKYEIKLPRDESPSTNKGKETKSKTVNLETDTKIKRKKWEKVKRHIQLINPAACAKGRFWYGLSIVILMFFYFGNAGGGQYIVSNFVRSYSIDQLQFSSESGTLINTSYWISFSAGRFLFFIFAKWVSVKILIFIEAFAATCAATLMAVFADESSIALWVLIQPIAFFWGPVWPTGVAWTDYHMELTGMGMTSQMLGGGLGGMLHMRLIGYLYDNIGPETYLYHVAGSAAFGLLLAVALDIIGARHGNRFVSEATEYVDGTDEAEKHSYDKGGKMTTRL